MTTLQKILVAILAIAFLAIVVRLAFTFLLWGVALLVFGAVIAVLIAEMFKRKK